MFYFDHHIYDSDIIYDFCDILLPSYNKIASLPEDLNSTLRKNLIGKVLINIAGNSLSCDCNLSFVKMKLESCSDVNRTGISFSDFTIKVQITKAKYLLKRSQNHCLSFQCGASSNSSMLLSSVPDSDLRCPLHPGELRGGDPCDAWNVPIMMDQTQITFCHSLQDHQA